MPRTIDTKSGQAVAQFVHQVFQGLLLGVSDPWIARIFTDVAALFLVRDPDYSAIGLRDHTPVPTVPASARLVELFAGTHRAEIEPMASCRQLELTKILGLPDSRVIPKASGIFWQRPSRVGSNLTPLPASKTFR